MKAKVFINGRFLTQRVTGVQRYAREVLRALDEALAAESTAIECVVLAPMGTQKPELRAIGFECIGPLTGNLWEQWTLPRYVGSGLLYSFGPTGPLLKQHQIITVHDAGVYRVPDAYSWRFRAWYKLLLGVLTRRVTHVVTVSEFSKREIIECFGGNPARISHTVEGWQHIKRSTADASILTRQGLRSRQFVLAVSSPTPNKNFQLVAQAVQLLGDCGFDIAIAGALDAGVFARNALPEAPFIKYLGYVSDGELRALYEHAGVFVYPSRYEGFGIPLIEAMASECPVIASNAASLPEVCGDAARFVPPDSPETLASVIRELMFNPEERATLIRRGLARVQQFSWESAARAHLACMLGALSGKA